jgi:protoheme IX farnesyltransferase
LAHYQNLSAQAEIQVDDCNLLPYIRPAFGARRRSILSMRSSIKNYVTLSKPTITALSVLMCAAGLWLAGSAHLGLVFWTLLGTGMAVASANALNMYLERNLDALMPRTARRPLPAGRMTPAAALIFGVVLGVLSLVILAVAANTLTAVLGAVALLGYVCIYTPLKRRSPLALVVGAIPGAMPPLMGWAAVTNNLDAPGLVIFGVLFIWQIPHFLAIAVRRKEQYARAGIKIVPVVRGNQVAKIQALAYATALIPVSLLLVIVGAAGWIYGLTSLLAGIWYWWSTATDFSLNDREGVWAKRVFSVSLLYLPLWMVGLCLDLTLL